MTKSKCFSSSMDVFPFSNDIKLYLKVDRSIQINQFRSQSPFYFVPHSQAGLASSDQVCADGRWLSHGRKPGH